MLSKLRHQMQVTSFRMPVDRKKEIGEIEIVRCLGGTATCPWKSALHDDFSGRAAGVTGPVFVSWARGFGRLPRDKKGKNEAKK